MGLTRIFRDLLKQWRFFREFTRKIDARPGLDDDTFFTRFYEGTSFPRDIPIRLRKLYADSFGSRWWKVQPQDRVKEVYDDFDFEDLLCDVEKQFGITIPDRVLQSLDGSFDSIVRYLASLK
jgi:hypothetical protein